MIRASRYADGVAHPEEVAADQLAEAIDPKRSLLWVDLAVPTQAELESVAAQLELSPLALEDLHHGGQRTKLEHYRHHFHVAVHDCTLSSSQVVTREVDLVFGDGWLVSARQRADDETDAEPFDVTPVAHRFEIERGPEGTTDEGFLLWAFLDVIVDRYFNVIDELDDRLDEAEEILFSEDERKDADGQQGIPRNVFELRRVMAHFRRAVAPLREVVAELLRREAECLGPAAIVRMQDVYDHVLRVADLLDSQRDLVTGLLEADLSMASNRMNDVMKRMTSWGAIILGSTLLAGIYGMNFEHMPELSWSFGYPAALGSMVLLTVFLYVWFKRRNWL